GTVFCVKPRHESSIYIPYNGQKVTAIKSWDGEIIDSDCFDVAFYFNTNTHKYIIVFQIYTAKFHPPNDLRITFIRDVEEGESNEGIMLLSRKINGRKVIYRACD
ncbi:hypothetical protein PFISCL1PPCAC_16976, partial [Pristionchus fissidentatus]